MEKTNRKKATVINLIYQYSSLVLTIIRGLLLVPLYIKYIDLKLYGAWLATGNIVVWLALMDPGLNELLRQQVAKFYGRGDLKSIGKTIGTGWTVMTALSIFTVIIGWFLSKIVPPLFLEEANLVSELGISIFFASIGAALVFFSGSPGAILQGFQRSGRFIVIYVISWILGFASTIILLLNGYGLISLPLGSVVSGTVMSLGCSIDMIYFTRTKLHIHLKWCTEYLNNIKTLVGASFLLQTSRVLTRNCDEFLIGLFLGPEVVPIVAFSKRLWDIALMFGQRVSVAFMPGMAHLWGEGEKNKVAKVAVRMLCVTMWLCCIETAIILGFNKSFLSLWVGSQFFAGHNFNLLLALSVFVYVYIYAIGQVLYASDDIKGPAVAGVLQSLLRVSLVVALLFFCGIFALPISTLVSSVLMLAVYFKKRFSIRMNVRNQIGERTGILSVILGITLGLIIAYTFNLTGWIELTIWVITGALITSTALMVVDKAFKQFAGDVIARILRLGSSSSN